MKRAALTSVLVLGFAGCSSMAPTYERPTSPVPKQLPATTTAATSSAQLSLGDFVRDPKLRTVIVQALAQNRDLRAAALSIESARQQYRISRAAALPAIDAGVSVTSARSITGPDNAATRSTLYSAQVGMAAWEIDLFGRLKSLANASEQQFLATVETAKATRISLIGELCTAYVALAADQSRLTIARETADLAKKTMELTDLLVSGGTSNRGDFFQASTVYQQARADVALLTAAIVQDRNALELLAGGPIAPELLPTALPEQLDWFADVPVGLSSAVLLERPDVLAAEHDLMAANANIGEARARFFPSITLTASGGLASLTLAALFTGPAAVFAIAPAIGVPLFRGGANRANLAYTKAQKQVFVATYERAIQIAFREVSDALAVRGTIEEQLSAQVALVDASTKAVELAQGRYKGGIDPFLTTLVSQRALYGAKNSLVSTQLAALVNRVTLYRVLGGGLR
jgi:multidrug efflux system outer membrane protein